MGAYNGKIVHFRNNDYCHPLLVTDDQAPDYHQDISGLQFDAGPGNVGAMITMRVDVEHDSIEEVEGSQMATFTNNTWHYDTECRAYYSQGL